MSQERGSVVGLRGRDKKEESLRVLRLIWDDGRGGTGLGGTGDPLTCVSSAKGLDFDFNLTDRPMKGLAETAFAGAGGRTNSASVDFEERRA